MLYFQRSKSINKVLKTTGIFLCLLAIALLVVGVLIRNPVLSHEKFNKLVHPSEPRIILKHLELLIKNPVAKNFENLDRINNVTEYILTHFKKHCESSSYQSYEVLGTKYKNVICNFQGQDKKKLVIGAHYDVASNQPGADDNASGVAGILELSRLISVNSIKPSRDIEIVAYTLEEPPFFRTEHMGSHFHAQSLRENDVSIYAMISVEMIGYFDPHIGSQKYPLPLLYLYYPWHGDFIALVTNFDHYSQTREIKRAFVSGSQMPLYSINAPPQVHGIDFSDHLNYWKFGHPAYMITDSAFFRNQHYHQHSDTLDRLDINRMAEVIDGLATIVAQ